MNGSQHHLDISAPDDAPAARFITFEGGDGVGKSTLLAVLADQLTRAGIAHISTREPGGTLLGESLRKTILDPAFSGMNRRAEVLLYTASRAQLTAEVIRPALERGVWVVADRFVDATLAYQGYGRGMDLEPLRDIQFWATGGLTPDVTVLLDCDVELARTRRHGRCDAPDRMEMASRVFHERVRAGYLELARLEPKRFIVLDASEPPETVISDFTAALSRKLGLPDLLLNKEKP